MVNKKRVSIKQHKLRGNPGKIANFDKLVAATPEPIKISPDVPLSIINKPYALEMWEIIAVELKNRDEFSKTYGGLIEAACNSWQIYQEAIKFIDAYTSSKGMVYKTSEKEDNNTIAPIPHFKIAREALQDYLKLMQEMALTPMSGTQKGFNVKKKDEVTELMKMLMAKE